jgi:hypothetical protein
MRLGYETGGSTAPDNVWGRRWLIVLLAFLLAAAGLFFTAPPGHAENGGNATLSAEDGCEGSEGFIEVYVTNDESGEFGLDDMDLVWIKLYEGETLIDTIDADGNLEDDIGQGGSSSTYTFDDVDDGDYWVEALVKWQGGEVASYPDDSASVDCDEEEGGTELNCAVDDCSDITDPFGENWTADIDCDGCTVLIRDPGTNPDGSQGFADIEVSGTDLKVKLTATGKGTPPGKAAVWADDALLPKCKGKNATDCVKIKRIKGAHTYYDVRVGEDPRFRFR